MHKFYGGTDTKNVKGFSPDGSTNIVVRAKLSRDELVSSVVHEGTHVLDTIDGIKGENRAWERRAYLAERDFAIAKKRPLRPELENLKTLNRHIRTYDKE